MERVLPSFRTSSDDTTRNKDVYMNLAHNLEASAFFFPDRPALRQAGSEWTYAQLNDQANRIATGLIKMGR